MATKRRVTYVEIRFAEEVGPLGDTDDPDTTPDGLWTASGLATQIRRALTSFNERISTDVEVEVLLLEDDTSPTTIRTEVP